MKKQKPSERPIPKEDTETFAEKATVIKMAIVHSAHPESKLSGEMAENIKRELTKRALTGKNVRIAGCLSEGVQMSTPKAGKDCCGTDPL